MVVKKIIYKRLMIPSVGAGTEKLELAYIAGGTVAQAGALGNSVAVS